MKNFLRGFRDALPIFFGYIAVSFTFGIAAKTAGLSTLQSVLMSASNVTSAGQFAAIGLIASSQGYLEMALTQLTINLRYCLMSSSLSQKLHEKVPLWHRLIIAFGVTDELFGVNISYPNKNVPISYALGAMSSAIPGWVLGTLIGSVSGSLLPQFILNALNIALYGMFIAIVIPPAKRDGKLAGVIVVSMLCSFIFSKVAFLSRISSGFKIIILTLVIASLAAILFPIQDEETEE